MLFIVNGRGVLASKRLLSARLATKRPASLTAAIERGARNASEIRERTKRYNSRPARESRRSETNVYGRFRSFEQQGRRRPVEYSQRQQRGDGPRVQIRSSYSSKDSPWAQGRESSERFPLTDGDRKSFSSKTAKLDSSLRADDRHRSNSRYLKRYVEETPSTQRSAQRLSSNGEDRGSLPRGLSTRRSSFGADNRVQSEPRYTNSYVDKNSRSQRPAKGLSINGEDRGPFTRKATTRESSLLADQEQGESVSSKSNNNRADRDLWPPERTSRGEGGRRSSARKPDDWQGFTRQDKQESTPEPEQGSRAARRHVRVPLAMPRSAAASEFIYGTSAVKAALQAGTRKLYKLYIYQGPSNAEQRGSGDKEFFRLAYKRNLEVKWVDGDGLPLLDKMAQGRPHNGLVLEASQLPNTPALALEMVDKPGNGFSFTADHQSAEDLAVNGTSNEISGSSSRYPFVLLLDSIPLSDPQLSLESILLSSSTTISLPSLRSRSRPPQAPQNSCAI